MPKRQITRALDRPHDGDAQPCPFCRAVMYFQEPTPNDEEPGWFCSCGYRILARQDSKLPFHDRQRALTERRARVFRKSMVVRARAALLQRESQRIVTARRRGGK